MGQWEIRGAEDGSGDRLDKSITSVIHTYV